jgi:type VI secretion system protein ImpM
MMAQVDDSPGFFGKLVSRGDFVRRRVPDAFVTCWDDWLQRAIKASRLQLGDEWLPAYLSAPIWRFALAEGVCGDAPWLGVLMPSVDRVGRYFPLTIAAVADPFRSELQMLSGAGGWFDAIERIALSALDEDLSLDDFDAALLELAVPKAEETALRLHTTLPDGENIGSALTKITTNLTRFAPAHHSLWWTDGSPHVQPCMLAHRALPQALLFTAMMTGSWAESGWLNKV